VRTAKTYLELTRPRITWLIVFSAAAGYYFGHLSAGGVGWNPLLLFNVLFGTALMASGTATLNQWYERSTDSRMTRTELRPLPSGRVTASSAFWFGVVLSCLGFLQLDLGANRLAAVLCLATLATYLFVYTPLKHKTWWSTTTIGAIPGAMPPLIGFAGAANALTPQAWAMGAILFLWQFPHFYAIALMYREDYARAGIQMLPVVEPDGKSTARQIVLFSVLLIPISVLPKWLGMSGNIYLLGTLLLGFWLLRAGLKLAFDRTRAHARSVLLASVVYLPILYLLMIVDPGHWL
jgi:protoheme IX farnesyltransferase